MKLKKVHFSEVSETFIIPARVAVPKRMYGKRNGNFAGVSTLMEEDALKEISRLIAEVHVMDGAMRKFVDAVLHSQIDKLDTNDQRSNSIRGTKISKKSKDRFEDTVLVAQDGNIHGSHLNSKRNKIPTGKEGRTIDGPCVKRNEKNQAPNKCPLSFRPSFSDENLTFAKAANARISRTKTPDTVHKNLHEYEDTDSNESVSTASTAALSVSISDESTGTKDMKKKQAPNKCPLSFRSSLSDENLTFAKAADARISRTKTPDKVHKNLHEYEDTDSNESVSSASTSALSVSISDESTGTKDINMKKPSRHRSGSDHFMAPRLDQRQTSNTDKAGNKSKNVSNARKLHVNSEKIPNHNPKKQAKPSKKRDAVFNSLYERSLSKQIEGKKRREAISRSISKAKEVSKVSAGWTVSVLQADTFYRRNIKIIVERDEKRAAMARRMKSEYHRMYNFNEQKRMQGNLKSKSALCP